MVNHVPIVHNRLVSTCSCMMSQLKFIALGIINSDPSVLVLQTYMYVHVCTYAQAVGPLIVKIHVQLRDTHEYHFY